jgi:hypothetical protein
MFQPCVDHLLVNQASANEHYDLCTIPIGQDHPWFTPLPCLHSDNRTPPLSSHDTSLVDYHDVYLGAATPRNERTSYVVHIFSVASDEGHTCVRVCPLVPLMLSLARTRTNSESSLPTSRCGSKSSKFLVRYTLSP